MRLGSRTLSRYDLYEMAVQAPSIQARFLRAVHGGSPRVLGEDFCGPASIARAWLALDEDVRAIITDLDAEPLEHAERALDRALGGAAAGRMTINHGDVLSAKGRADVIASLNFAVCELRDRASLMTYLRSTLVRLEARGVLVADLYAGSSSLLRGTSSQTIDTPDGPVVYTWEQREVDPLSGLVTCAMHFDGPGGQRLEDAFVYQWRLWSIPELRDAMREAGFASTEVHLGFGEALDENGDPVVVAACSDVYPGPPTDLDDEELESLVAYVVARV